MKPAACLSSVPIWLVMASSAIAEAQPETLARHAEPSPGQRSEVAIPPQTLTLRGVEFVLIPAGEFIYTVETGGTFNFQPAGEPFYRHVEVHLEGFYMARHEARARDLARFLNSGAASPELIDSYTKEWRDRGEGETAEDTGCTMARRADGLFEAASDEDLPATYLSWELANAFAAWMGFRLPSEAEWQKAARGSDRRIWPWGDTYPDDTFVRFRFGRDCHPASVASYPKGRSPYGMHHMSGNVLEYVTDWFNEAFDDAVEDGDSDPQPAVSGSAIPHDRTKRITKGGRWSGNPASLAIATRHLADPEGATNRSGVRFAIDIANALAMVRLEKGGAE